MSVQNANSSLGANGVLSSLGIGVVLFLTVLQIGCNWFSSKTSTADLLAASAAATEGTWDEDGTVTGYEKMIHRYEKVLHQNPTDVTALTETAYAYSRIAWVRHFNAQYDLFNKLQRNPTSSSEISELYQKSDSFLQRARDIDSSGEIVLAVDSVIQRLRGNNPQAVSLAQQAYRPDTLNPRVLEAYEITKIDPKESRELYRRCINVAPNNAYYWWQFANFETDSATKESAYNRALELSPQYALPKISRATSRWIFSMERLKGLGEVANASPELAAYARHKRLLSFMDLGGVILFWLLGLVTFRARSLGWFWLLGILLVVRGAITLAPGINDTAILFNGLQDVVSSVLGITTIALVWNFVGTQFWRNSDSMFYRLSHRVTRGFLGVMKSILQIPPESIRADFSYVIVFGELILLNWFAYHVFARLSHWW